MSLDGLCEQVVAGSIQGPECTHLLCCCRYLIQNLCGSHLCYWSYEEERPGGGRVPKRRVLLPAHSMQELKVQQCVQLQLRQPAAKLLRETAQRM
jgi:hypothetical protein